MTHAPFSSADPRKQIPFSQNPDTMKNRKTKRQTPNNLLYTIAFDPPGCTIIRAQAKLFVLSLLRTCFDGDIIVFTNSRKPMFPTGRLGVTEIRIDTQRKKESALAEFACAFKYLAINYIANPEKYGRILFTDCDCLALRNLAPLYQYEEDIIWAAEPGTTIAAPWYSGYFTEEEKLSAHVGVNAGTWSIKGKKMTEVVAAMDGIIRQGPLEEQVFWGDQPAWNKLIFSGKFSNRAFSSLDLRFPMVHHTHYKEYTEAALVHVCGATVEQKTRFLFGLFADRFYFDAAPMILDVIET
jgi:hypothetical protein